MRVVRSGDLLELHTDNQGGRQLIGHGGAIYCAAFGRDGKRLASGGNDATIRLWDTATGEQLLVLRGHGEHVHGVAFSPDGTVLASASGDTTVRFRDTKRLHERRAMAGRQGQPSGRARGLL